MNAPECTIDTSCVIALDHLGLLPQLSFLFSRVLLPKAVRVELFRRRKTKDRLQYLLGSYAFLERCDDYDKGTVDFLLAEKARQGVRDRGEAEVIIQAVHRGTMVILDDPWGQDLAARDALDCHGTLWVLTRFHELGLVSSTATRANFTALRNRGIRLPWDIVDTFLMQIGQEPLRLK